MTYKLAQNDLIHAMSAMTIDFMPKNKVRRKISDNKVIFKGATSISIIKSINKYEREIRPF